MSTIRHLLSEKGDEVWTVSPQDSILTVLKLMDEKKAGVVIVVQAEKIVGIFSERDFARDVAHNSALGLDTPVGDLMTQLIYFIEPDKSVDEGLALMTDRRIRHLPVMDKSRLVGLVSIGDLVKHVLEEKETTIHSLENYIMGHDYNR
jgi:CBS domain-containing protein